MGTKLIILVGLGLLVFALLVTTIARAWHYIRNHPEQNTNSNNKRNDRTDKQKKV